MERFEPKTISLNKIFIHTFEFRKSIIDLGNNTYEAYVSISYTLLKDGCDLFKYFRDNNDEVVCHIARTYNVRLHFNKEAGKIKIFNKLSTLQSNYDDIRNGIDAVMERIKIDMDYLSHKQKLPMRNYKKRSHDTHDTHIDEPMKKIQKTIPDQSQVTQNPFPGLVMVIDKPSPELVSKLFTMNINYTFLPEFLIKQMLNIHNTIPPSIEPSPPPMSHIPSGVLPSFVQNPNHNNREEGEI
jgi:hypothetical protein